MATPSIRRPDLPAGLSYEKPVTTAAAPALPSIARPALPEGLSYEPPAPAAAPALKQPRSWGRAAGDLGVGLAEGAVSAGLAIPQLVNTLSGGAIDEAWRPLTGAVDRLAGGPGEGRSLAQSSQDTRAALDELKSPQLREAEQNLAQTKGFLPSAKAILTNPMLLSQQVAEQVPQFIVPAGAARKVGASVLEKVGAEALAKGTAKRVAAGLGEQEAAQLAMPAANRLAQRAASKAAGRAVMGTSGAIGASQASEQAQQEVMGLDQSVMDANPEYRQLRAQGLSDADARQKLAITAGMKAGAIALPLDTLTSGLSARLEGNIFRGHTGVDGLSQLLSKRGAAGVVKAAGKEGAEETLQEGGEQFAQNVGVQGVDPNKSLMDQVPEQAALGGTIGAVLGAGGFAGSSALSRPSVHAAPPGSLTDAASVLSRPANGPIARAAQEGVANGAVAAAAQQAPAQAEAPSAQSTRIDPGMPPWADTSTGELANPSPADLIRALADHMVAQHQATGDMRINPQQIAEAWGVPKGAVERTRKAATTRASDQLAAAERAAMAPPAAPTPEAGTTASIPFMITQQMRADLRALGHTPAAIAGMTPEQANAALQAGPVADDTAAPAAPQETTHDERVPEPAPAAPAGAGAEAARAADEQPAAGGEPQQPAGSAAAAQPAPDSATAVAGERPAADAGEALITPSKEAPADAETPASAAPAPGPGGNPAAVAGEGGEPAAGAAETGAPAAAAEAPAEPKAKVTRAPKAPKGSAAAPANHVHAAIQRIAEGEHPEKVLAEADEATVRAVGAAMGKRFSTKAPLGAMVERIGETAASDRRRLAADALVKMGREKAAEAPPLQPVPSPAPRSTQSVAARKAESLRVKTPTGEVNGRSHVDHLIKDGYTQLTSLRAGDKLVHSLAKADGTSEKIHARQLAYAQERLAAPAEQPAAAPAPATADKRQQIEKDFAENKAAIAEHKFKAGDAVTFTQNGKTITGTIAKGDKAGMVKDMGVFEVEHPGRGGMARTTIGARFLMRAEPAPAADKAAPPAVKENLTVAPTTEESSAVVAVTADDPETAAFKASLRKAVRDGAVLVDGSNRYTGNLRPATPVRAVRVVSGVATQLVKSSGSDGAVRYDVVATDTGSHIASGSTQKEAIARARQAGEGPKAKAVAERVATDRQGLAARRATFNAYAGLDDAAAAVKDRVEAAADAAASSPNNDKPEPTPAQKEAGNYEKGHVSVQGLDISIENPRGSTRSGVGENGKPWSHVMTDHYGYIRRTEGADGEQVDVYVGPNPASDHVYVVDQLDQKTGKFDEHKAMIGFDSEAEAVKAYRGNFDPGWKVGPVHAMSMDEFKGWLKEGDTTKPVAASPVVSRSLTTRLVESTAPSGKAAKPRLAESAGDLWTAIKTLSATGVPEKGTGRILYPQLRVVAGDTYIANGNGELSILDKKTGGVGVKAATAKQADAFHHDLAADRVEVVLATAPGFGSGYSHQRVLQVLHSPSGKDFEAPATAAARVTTAKPVSAPPPSSTLSDADFTKHLSAYAAQYRELAGREAHNPDYFNADLAKEMFPEYSASKAARRDNNEKVAGRASKIAFTAFEQRLKESTNPDEVVTLMAGGTGSGKSALKPEHGIVYDSTMYDSAAAKRNVKMVLDSGRGVEYRYVFTEPDSAFRAAIERGRGGGRYVNLTAFVRTHEGAYKTVQELMRDYAGDDRVRFHLYDNTDFGQRQIEAVPAFDYNGLREHLHAILDQEHAGGRVSDAEYRAIAKSAPAARQQGQAVSDAKDAGRGSRADQDRRPEQSEGLVTPPETPPTGGVSASTATGAALDDSTTTSTDDVGAELWYNRRNRTGNGLQWSDIEGLNDTLRAKEAVKSKVWPRPDYEQLVADGLNPVLAHLVKQVYDTVSAKPRVRGAATDAQMQGYVTTVGRIRDAVFEFVRDNERVRQVARRVAGVLGNELQSAPGEVELNRLMSKADTTMLDAVFPATDGNRWRGSEQGSTNNARALLVGGNNLVRALQVGRDELVKALQAGSEGWPAKQAAWQRLYQIKSSNGVFRVLRAGRYVATDLPSRAEAEQAAMAHYEKARKKSATALPNDALKAEQSKREGPARRAPGEDVSSERLMETFGFRGINFGNWMKGDTKAKQRERQLHLNHTYDALADLAELTGLPMRAIGLEGKLGLAFGAQGHGGRNAGHFVPGVNEINLTRTAGAGVIAHEWAHALDHYFAVQAGEKIARLPDPFLTRWSADEKQTAGVRPEIRQAFQKIVNAMKTRPVSAEDLAAREDRGRKHVAEAMDRAFVGLKQYTDSTKLDAAAIADFDALAQRLRDGDTGEGYVETGTTAKVGRRNVPVTVSQTAGQLLHLLSENGAVKTSDTRLVLNNVTEIDRLARQMAYMQDAARQPATPTQRSNYMAQARRLESDAAMKKGEPYWSNDWELFARAFQSYVIDKLAKEGRRSDYLSYPQRSEEATKALMDEGLIAGDMWPRGAERERIDAAFDVLLGEIKTREDDTGNVALFRKTSDSPDAPVTPTQKAHTARIEQLATSAMGAWKGDDRPGLRVVDTPEQLPPSARFDAAGNPSTAYQSAAGMYDGRTIWIVASKHTTDQAGIKKLLTTMAHEGVGHYGVDRIVERELGAGAWTKIEDAADRLRQNPDKASPAIRAVLDELDKRYAGADRKTYAREFMAVTAERGVKNGLLDRVVTALRRWLRRVLPDLRLSEHELRQLLVASDRYLRVGETQQQRVQSRAALAFSIDNQTDTPAFRKFFGDSKVVDAAGNPLPVYHGTAEEFDTFDPARSGSTTAHMTANLGTFFAEDRAKAQHYAENASQGVPAEERVIDAYLAIRKPYTMSVKQFMGLDSQEESAALRAKLIKEGYDGIHIPEVRQWIAFQPNQIKSASENRGGFDTSTGNIYFSRDDADPDNPNPTPRPFGDASASIETMQAELPQLDRSAFQKGKDWLAGKARDFEPAALGALQLRHVLELAADDPTLKAPAKAYADLYQRMDGDRNQMQQTGAEKVDALQKWARTPGAAGWLSGKLRPEARQLFKFMHAVTQLAVDPTNAYEKLLMRDSHNEYKPWTKDLIKERKKVLREAALSRSGDDKTRILDELKELDRLPQRERVRAERYPKLVAQWNALSPEAKHHFEVMRDHYQEQSTALEEATVQQLQSLDIPDQNKRTAIQMVRNNFRDAKVDGVYFPLTRFGDYWISLRKKDGEYVFAKYETANAMVQAEKQWLAAGATIEARGRQDNNYRAKDAPSGTFIGDLMGILKNAPDKTKDEIYQMYLKTLPALSLRKHGIHRSNIAGYSDDVPRAFAGSVFHGAHQISKARYGWRLQSTMEQMRERMEARRTTITAAQAAHGDALLGELARRHDWVMNPTNSQLASKLTSIGFSYYLAASPASALVNLIQVPQIVLPVLGAQHGWGRATRVLTATMRDAIRTGGHIDKVLTGEDLQAFKALAEQGTFQRSAAHALASISEGDQLRASPVYTRVMNAVSWMFHTSEVINREGTGMAAFRLARAKGMAFDAAVKYADEITNGTHGDYSNANRARYMQGNTMKVLTQFKNYSLAMSWLWGRQFHQAFKGESPEVRATARRTLTGLLGMTGLFAGVVGMPIFNLLRYGAMAAHAVTGDPDEPWDFMTEFRAWLSEHLGDTAASLIADGAVSQLGANVASRVSMSDLWFRDADRQLEGEDAYNAMLQAIAGPLGGMIKNMYVGAQQFNEGHVERGIETMLPTFAKNAVKSVRFASQGVNTLRGDPIVADISGPEALIQAIGFQPTRVARQQRENNSLYTYQQAIKDRRQALMNGFAMAQQAGDAEGRAEALRRIRAFNAKNPEVAIGMANLHASLRGRAQFSAQASNGIRLDRKLAARLRREVGATPPP